MADFNPSPEPRDDRRFFVFGIAPPSGELAERIDARVDAMFAAGLAEEVEALSAKGHSASEPGMRAIGYRESSWPRTRPRQWRKPRPCPPARGWQPSQKR